MKMSAEDYGLLAGLIIQVIDSKKKQDETRRTYVEYSVMDMAKNKPQIKDPASVVRWQLFHVALSLPTIYNGQFTGFVGKLAEYLNDSHIDTALRRIIKDLDK